VNVSIHYTKLGSQIHIGNLAILGTTVVENVWNYCRTRTKRHTYPKKRI